MRNKGLLTLFLLAYSPRVSAAPTCPWCPDLAKICPGWPYPNGSAITTHYENPDLPDLLTLLNGTKINGLGPLWDLRKLEIRKLLQEYIYGEIPKEVPILVRSELVSNASSLRGGLSQVHRHFFRANATLVSFETELILPQDYDSGSSKRPLFVTQTNHRRWALKGLARGYINLVVPSADVNDQTEGFAKAYSAASWGLIIRRAWLISRALDFAVGLSYVDTSSVSVSGHSRNGKQAMLAAAFDERITSLVSSSSGSPGMTPYRLTSANTFAEGPGDAPVEWWLNKTSCFKGYEHKLPIDSHGLLALIAPRHMLAATAWTDGCEPVWAVERAYKASQKVYQLYGSENNLRIKYRPGQHHGYLDVDSYFDWFDVARGRPGFDSSLFPEALLLDFNWTLWSQGVPPGMRYPPKSSTVLEKIVWSLGNAPPAATSPGGHYGEQCDDGPQSNGCFMATLLTHDRFHGDNTTKNITIMRQDLNFGEYITGSLYFQNTSKALPSVVFLHPLSYQTGFAEGYIESEKQIAIYYALAKAGFVVFAYDAISFGARLTEMNGAAGGNQGGNGLPLFYRRYPTWSLLGKIVHDSLAAIDMIFLSQTKPFPGFDKPLNLPRLDTSNVFLLGYDIGGRAALYAGALSSAKRLKGIISINGWTPMRSDTSSSPTGGIKRLWDWYALQPHLGFYDGRENELPFDIDDVISETRVPTYIYQQEFDRTVNFDDVRSAVKSAEAKGASVSFQSSQMVNRLDDEVHAKIIDWLEKRCKE